MKVSYATLRHPLPLFDTQAEDGTTPLMQTCSWPTSLIEGCQSRMLFNITHCMISAQAVQELKRWRNSITSDVPT